MTEPDGVHAWLLRLVRAQAHGYGWADLREGFLERATDVLRQPNALWEFSAKNQEKLVWNIAFGAAEAIRARRVHLGAKVAFVDACPGFFASYYGELAEYSQSCDMFWDIVISDARHGEQELKDHIFAALSEQLLVPNRFVQLSALHGFNHLQDLRCGPVIHEFLKGCENEYVRAYAAVARKFEAM